MNEKVDLNKYFEFVDRVTSNQSKDLEELFKRMRELQDQNPNINIARWMTGSYGLSSESGEFNELPKKILFQGKPLDEDTIFHMKRELGDIMWYWINAVVALGLDPNDVIAENVRKLESRFEGGGFSVFLSENRKEDDL